MKPYIAILTTVRSFGESEYPSLFAYFAKLQPCASFSEKDTGCTLIGFWSDQSAQVVKDTLLEHIHDTDEILVFAVQEAAWKADEKRNERLLRVFQDAK